MFDKLKEPFKASDIVWRVQRSGESNGKPWAMVLAYVDARAIMDRLDKVVGEQNWYDDYKHIYEGDRIKGVQCFLSINLPGIDKVVTKVDGSPETDIEAFKGGYSKALVRTAVKWGIGRYLYKLPATFATCTTTKPSNLDGWKRDKTKSGTWFYWKIPTLSKEFLP